MQVYKERSIQFIEVFETENWKLKLYSITVHKEYNKLFIEAAKQQIENCLAEGINNKFPVYGIATCIVHECKENILTILSWWTGENMLQTRVYESSYQSPTQFRFFSADGIFTCVWEMQIHWFERNAWVEHVLMKADDPDFETYLKQQYQQIV